MAGVFQGLAPPTKENTLYHKYKISAFKEKLVAHIILILGKAGAKEKAHYSVDKGLNLALNSNLNKVSKNLSTANAGKNSAQMPLNSHQNFIKEGEFLILRIVCLKVLKMLATR